MAKTLGIMLYELRARIDEPVENRWKDRELRTWINEGLREVATRTECLRDTASIAVVAGTQSYTMPTDIVREHNVEFDPTGSQQTFTLERRDYRAMQQWWGSYQTTSGYAPSFYTTWGFPGDMQVIIYPVPSVDGTLTVFYYRLPALLSVFGDADGTAVEVPEGWESVVLDWAEQKAYFKDRRPQDAGIAKERFDQGLSALAETAIRYSDAPGEILYDQTVGGGPFDEWGGLGW